MDQYILYEILIRLLIGGVVGGICLAIAQSKGRNKLGWFFLGFFVSFIFHICGGWIPILIVSVLPNLNEMKARDEYMSRENRRLREQLRQERMKSEAFRQHTQSRLDAHDDHLGLDTRSVNTTALPGSTSAPGGLLESQADAGDTGLAQWYYELNGESVGPTSSEQIARLLREGHLSAATLVWAEHLGDWTAASNVPDFVDHLDRDNPI